MRNEDGHLWGSLETELKILVLCSQTSMSEEHVQFLHDSCNICPDWDRVFSLSNRHGVFPLLFRNLKLHFPHLLSAEVSQEFKRNYQQIGARNLFMTGALIKSISALQGQGIRAFPFKGPVLAALYGDLSLRQFGDLDILVDRSDVFQAVQILEDLGYHPPCTLSRSQLTKLSQTDNEFPLFHRQTGITLDLQWELTGGYFRHEMKLSDLLGHLKPIRIAGLEAQTFWDEDLLLYLCIHGNQHVWQRLDHICCVNELLRATPGLNWELVISKAKRLGAYRMLGIGVLLAHTLLNSHLPESLINTFKRDGGAVILAGEVCQKLVLPSDDQQGEGSISHRFNFYHLKSLDSKLDAVKYAFRLMCLPTRYDWVKFPLPAKWSFLHYIIRPFRMVHQWLL